MLGFKAALMATIVATGVLAGCRGGGGEEERQALIDENVKSCVEGFNKNGGAVAGNLDGQRICRCAHQKMAEGKSIEEIRDNTKRNDPTQADLQAMGACLVEEAQRKGVLNQ